MNRVLTTASLAGTLLLIGCGPAVPPPSRTPPPPPAPQQQVLQTPPTRPVPPPSTRFRQPPVKDGAGFEGVTGASAADLIKLFGQPQLDSREGDVRKLQFAGDACVLDVFLYPVRDHGQPEATWFEARRRSDGLEVDRAACIAALKH